MGVMNGEVTPVAIMLLPAGRCCSMGRATHSNTWFWNGSRQMNRSSSVATELSRRRRSSSRCAISVGLTSASPAPLSGGVVTLHRGLGGTPGGVVAGRLQHRGARALGRLAHLLGGELTLDLLVEVPE